MHAASIEVLEVVPRFRDGATSTDRADLRCGGRLTDADGRVVLALEALQVVRYRAPRER